MDTYKSINRELTLKNQELRQLVAIIKEDALILQRNLASEKEKTIMLRHSIMKIISLTTQSFNDIIKELYTNGILDKCTLQESPEASRYLRKSASVHQRQLGTSNEYSRSNSQLTCTNDHSNKENTRPNDDNVTNMSVPINTQASSKELTNNISSRSEESAMLNSFYNLENTAASCEENEMREQEMNDSINHDMFTIAEENSNEFIQTIDDISERNKDPTVISIVENTRNNIAIRDVHRSRRKSEPRKEISSKQTNIEITLDTTNEEDSDESSTHDTIEERRENNPPTQINRSEIIQKSGNETTFESFSVLKALSSTPYKTTKKRNIEPINLKELKVMVKKLDLSQLQLHTNNLPENRSSSKFVTLRRRISKRKKKRVSPDNPIENCCLDTSEDIIRPTRKKKQQMLVDSSGSDTSETTIKRPRRKAAPSTMKEPNLMVKLRRKL